MRDLNAKRAAGCRYAAKNYAKYREYRKRRRRRVIEHYGGKCVCCGESCLAFLTIDHPEGGGRKHRSHRRIYDALLKEGLPAGYRVMCWNCNCARQFNGGRCPHKDKTS